jgi:hypothetical protein
MSESVQRVDPTLALSAAHAALDDLLGLDVTGLDDEAMLAYWRELERLRRRVPAAEHALVLEAEARGLPERLEVRSVTALLRGLLRVDPGEAAARVRAAEAAGPRRTLTGQPVPALCPAVTAAQAGGEISDRHARIVVQTLGQLPEQVRAERGTEIETDLDEFCRQFEPLNVAKLAERVLAYHDPDGPLAAVEHRDKHRDLTVQQRVDGSSRLFGDLTAEATELLLLHFDALARPRPAADGMKDPRTAGQRRHDALLEALKLNVRARQLPTVAGVTATVVMTMTAEQFESRRGLARTAPRGVGARARGVPHDRRRVPADERGHRQNPRHHRLQQHPATLHRTATPRPRRPRRRVHLPRLFNARILVRDRSCDRLCPRRPGQRRLRRSGLSPRQQHPQNQGWRSARTNGRAAWVPPRWIDPRQKPRYNRLHILEPPP